MLPACEAAPFHRFLIEAAAMIVATRLLTLRRAQGDVEIPIRIFAPEPQEIDWSCRIEIDWPDEKLARAAVGVDAIQAIELALRMVGAQIYASDHHKSGALEWLEPGKGYGFPVPNNIRDLLVGDDQRFL
jgi:hypothetical protein